MASSTHYLDVFAADDNKHYGKCSSPSFSLAPPHLLSNECCMGANSHPTGESRKVNSSKTRCAHDRLRRQLRYQNNFDELSRRDACCERTDGQIMNQSAKLWLKTSLHPVFRNVTRLEQFFLPKPSMDMEDTETWLFFPVQQRKKSDFSSAEARVLFEGVLETFGTKYGALEKHLQWNSQFVAAADFERAIRCANNGATLTLEQNDFSMKQIHFTQTNPLVALESSPDFASQFLNESATSNLPYPHSKRIYPTANSIKRFFSVARYFLTDYRSGIAPNNLEAQLFFHVHREFWIDRSVKQFLIE